MSNNTSLNYEQLHDFIKEGLEAWHSPTFTYSNTFTIHLTLQEQIDRIANNHKPENIRLAINTWLLEAIEQLESKNEKAAIVLKEKFINGEKLWSIANQLNLSESTVSRLKTKSIHQLTETILANEIVIREQRATQLESQIPPPTYTKLFGVENAKEQLKLALSSQKSSGVIAITGLGGIGKTALAHSLVTELIYHFIFKDVIWLRVEPLTLSGKSQKAHVAYEALIASLFKTLFPEMSAIKLLNDRLFHIRRALKGASYLIVIDNLENDYHVEYLLAHLTGLSNPTQFLLTSRTRLLEQSSILNIFLNELSLKDAELFLRHHANEIGVFELAEASKEDISIIYQIVGGNPLALKLITTLLDLLSLPQIVKNINKRKEGRFDDLLNNIFWQSWQLLSPTARIILEAMPVTSESGATFPYLATVTGLEEAELWPALHELRHRSLIIVFGGIHEKRYGIHHLTRTFLKNEIINIE